jgi:hypothetical protein
MSENKVDVKQLDEQALFSQALEVMNRAIRAHEDDFPYKQILSASDKLMDDRKVAVALTKEPGGAPYDFYTVRFDDGHWKLEGRGKQDDTSVHWSVTRDYLEEIVKDPEPYVAHPEKLDLDWLKSRLGIG